MSTIERTEPVSVSASNIGGIEETAVDLRPGVNVLVGRNATNRTSFLQSLMAAVGSEDVSLRGGADEGRVELEWEGDVVTRTLTRENSHVSFGGDPLLDDPTLADLFAFLLENNEARRAVARGDNLRDLIMRPVDTERIKSRIDDLQAEKRRLDERIKETERAESRRPELEARKEELEAEIEETEAELEAKRQEIEEADAGVEESREEKAELEDALDELNDRRSELKRTRERLQSERDSLASLREERDEVEAELADLSEAPEDEIAYLDDRIDSLRAEKRSLESTLKQLQSLIQFNEEMLNGDNEDLLQILADEDGHSHDDVTAGLLPDSNETGVCWTCGSEVDQEEIESTLDQLRDVADEKREERSTVTDELEEVQSEKQELEETSRRQKRLQNRLEELDEETDSREETIERLQEQRGDLEDDVEDLEETVEELEEESYSALLDLHREANQLEFRLDSLTDDLDDVETELAEVESTIEKRESLETERDEVKAELQDLRTRIDSLEENAVESFNEHMEEVLDVLDYENIDRIWIDRAETEVREGRRKVEKTTFDLHVVRTTEDGVAYEDTVDHLSESEREVTGLVFALAGYRVHDVHEEVPFVLLDSLEAIDSERIAALVDYFEQYVPFVVVALLPEDAQALDDDYHRVRDI
ncbi:archaea-specific SMC-related protein [Halospeciosus flavus]|uniref:Archaea-specific SMC-related protein n=1 Tax=Halospeciosus flavus TaxID=3032283 RepID=A0ABD5Z0J2_9EURY|nr:archaea-specific SMC-related protein [Halospeciosus flavus]